MEGEKEELEGGQISVVGGDEYVAGPSWHLWGCSIL